MIEEHRNANAGTAEIDQAWKEDEKRAISEIIYFINNNIKFFSLNKT